MLKIQDDDVPTPQEATDHLWELSLQLAGHGVAEEHIEALQLISQRFTHHLNGLPTLTSRCTTWPNGSLLCEPIQVAERQLLKQLITIGRMPQVPDEHVEELFRIHLRLTAHIFHLRHKKALLDAAQADLVGI